MGVFSVLFWFGFRIWAFSAAQSRHGIGNDCPSWLRRDSSLTRAIEGAGRERVGVEEFEEAGGRSGPGVDGAPEVSDGGGAFNVVTSAGAAGATEADTGGNQVDGNRGQIAVNDRRVTAP